MTLVRWQATVQNDAGDAVVNPSVTVRKASDNSLADIFDDAGSAKANPFIGTSEGFVSFRANPGEYIIQGASGAENAPDWRVTLGAGFNNGFVSRAALLAALSWQWPVGSVASDGAVQYEYIGTGSVIPDMPGWVPFGPVTPFHWGGVANGVFDDTAAVTAAWGYVLSLVSVQGAQFADSDQPALYFPQGHWKSTAGMVLAFSGTGVTIYGDGPVSQLDKIDIKINGSYRANIRNLSLRGVSAAGIDVCQSGATVGREYLVESVRVRDKTVGIHLNASTWGKYIGCFVEKCTTNLLVTKTYGDSFIGCEFSSATQYNIDIVNGGELKMTDCRAMNAGIANMRITGTDDVNTVEHYFSGLTCTQAQIGGRSYAITSITDNGSGKVRVTTATAHEMVTGLLNVGLAGTAYDGTGYDVIDVISPTVFDLDLSFVATGGAVGTVQMAGWDLIIAAASRVSNVNDLYFTGCNFNFTKIDGAFNVNFQNCRMKEQVWIGNTYGVNRLHFSRSGRGRQTNPWGDIPICGPGSHRGWSELVTLGNTMAVNGQEKLAMRVPNTASGVGSNNLPVAINSVEVMGAQVNFGVGANQITLANAGFGGAMQMLLPSTGQIDAANTVKAFGRVTWSGADVALGSQSYNIASITSEDASATGRVLITLSDSTTGLDDNLVVVCTPNSGLAGGSVQTSLIEDGRIKVNGYNVSGAAARIPFSFVVMGIAS